MLKHASNDSDLEWSILEIQWKYNWKLSITIQYYQQMQMYSNWIDWKAYHRNIVYNKSNFDNSNTKLQW